MTWQKNVKSSDRDPGVRRGEYGAEMHTIALVRYGEEVSWDYRTQTDSKEVKKAVLLLHPRSTLA